jgi:uncharacterized membrane protein
MIDGKGSSRRRKGGEGKKTRAENCLSIAYLNLRSNLILWLKTNSHSNFESFALFYLAITTYIFLVTLTEVVFAVMPKGSLCFKPVLGLS